jgi:hypothetical protein
MFSAGNAPPEYPGSDSTRSFVFFALAQEGEDKKRARRRAT